MEKGTVLNMQGQRLHEPVKMTPVIELILDLQQPFKTMQEIEVMISSKYKVEKL